MPSPRFTPCATASANLRSFCCSEWRREIPIDCTSGTLFDTSVPIARANRADFRFAQRFPSTGIRSRMLSHHMRPDTVRIYAASDERRKATTPVITIQPYVFTNLLDSSMIIVGSGIFRCESLKHLRKSRHHEVQHEDYRTVPTMDKSAGINH